MSYLRIFEVSGNFSRRSMKIQNLAFLLFLTILSCSKTEKDFPGIPYLTDLKNYNIKTIKISDSTSRVIGENENYKIEGIINTIKNSKEGWWTIQSRSKDEIVEVEYITLKKEKVNQFKILLNGKTLTSVSRFYVSKFEKDTFKIKAYFPEELDKNPNYRAELKYYIADTINKRISQQIELKMVKKSNFYYSNIPLEEDENAVIGYLSHWGSKNLAKDSIQLSNTTIYFKDRRK